MNIKDIIKNNSFIRGIYCLCQQYFGNLNKKKLGYCGEKVNLFPPLDIIGNENVFLYGLNKIEKATISTPLAKFVMKYGSAAAEGLCVHTGNHMRLIGKNYRTITNQDKIVSDRVWDKDVIVEENVWIGCNVTLLSGVIIGRGTTIAAGAVVAKSMPPYCVCGGVPAKFIKFYWTIDQILEHESKLYPENERYTREQLEEIFAKYSK